MSILTNLLVLCRLEMCIMMHKQDENMESSLIFPVGKFIYSERIRRKAILNCKQSYKPLKGVNVISSSLYKDG